MKRDKRKKRDFNRKHYGDDFKRPKNKPYKRRKNDGFSNDKMEITEEEDLSDKN